MKFSGNKGKYGREMKRYVGGKKRKGLVGERKQQVHKQ
jgi:hypothetical protein